MSNKPLGQRAYGHIPHLPGSRLGPGDHHVSAGQATIATEKARDRHDQIFVQEKLDGTCVSVAKLNGALVPLMRAGYLARDSKFEQHHWFADWAEQHAARFDALLREGERACGEWLAQAHGTRYDLPYLTVEPFVLFDIMRGHERLTMVDLVERVEDARDAGNEFVMPALLHFGAPFAVADALAMLTQSVPSARVDGTRHEFFGYHYGFHGALDVPEGAVWRVERNELVSPGKSDERRWRVDFLCKYVRPDKKDGAYLPEVSGGAAVWNWRPESEAATV